MILVSAGHTNVPGKDRGAAGNGLIEGDLATRLRDTVARDIRARRPEYIVLEDGADGVNDPLTKAVALAKKADVAVEFHWNAGPKTATGIEVLSKPKHKKLAQELAQAIAKATGLKVRGSGGWKSDSSGQHHRLAFCEAGGLIVEVCFISNPDDVTAYVKNFAQVSRNLAAVLCQDENGHIPALPNPAPAEPTKPTVETETSETTGPDQKPYSEPALPLPTDSTITGDPNSDQGQAGVSDAIIQGGGSSDPSTLNTSAGFTPNKFQAFVPQIDTAKAWIKRVTAGTFAGSVLAYLGDLPQWLQIGLFGLLVLVVAGSIVMFVKYHSQIFAYVTSMNTLRATDGVHDPVISAPTPR